MVRYQCMTSTQGLVEIHNCEHPIAGHNTQHLDMRSRLINRNARPDNNQL